MCESVCAFQCAWVYVYVFQYAFEYVCACFSVWAYICVCISVYVHVCVSAFQCVSVYVWVCFSVRACICVYVSMYIRVCVHFSVWVHENVCAFVCVPPRQTASCSWPLVTKRGRSGLYGITQMPLSFKLLWGVRSWGFVCLFLPWGVLASRVVHFSRAPVSHPVTYLLPWVWILCRSFKFVCLVFFAPLVVGFVKHHCKFVSVIWIHVFVIM